MSNRTASAQRAVREAWENEKRLVLEGRGTRDWTDEQQKQIAKKGRAYDDRGRAFEGQHMKSVSVYPEYQGDACNIQLLSHEEHLAAHGGNYRNPTNGYYDPVSKTMSDFGDGPPQPCAEVPLTSPMYVETLNVASTQSPEAGSEALDAIVTTTASRTWNSPSLQRHVQRVWRNRGPWIAAGSVFIGVGKLFMDAATKDRPQTGDRIAGPSTQPHVATDPGLGDESLHEARKSPDEHDVSGYTRRDGTPVRPYRRGGKSD